MKQNAEDKIKTVDFEPLATRMRPQNLKEFIGQTHLLAPGKPLRYALDQGLLHSMIFWGPPGTGKTTLAQLIATKTHADFKRLSAVFSGVKDIRQVVETAKKLKEKAGTATILFVDEVHRFNKSQQDSFLPFVEDGTIILIGATTENPSFELNSALLSRARVYVLKRLTDNELLTVIENALTDKTRGLGKLHIDFPAELRLILVRAADGDARQVLNILEIIADQVDERGYITVTKELLKEILQVNLRRFDKQGEVFYDQISALHKSVRGSAPDAALYWLCRMLDGGCDPLYLARRIVRMAIEDIGLADPRALTLCLEAWNTYERLGSPEGELALAQAVIYLACCAKSNAAYTAYNEAMAVAKESGSLEVPLHIRNAPTGLMKSLGYGKNYRYAHDEAEGYAAAENYFPAELKSQVFYHPTNRGLEAKITERLAFLKNLDNQAKKKK